MELQFTDWHWLILGMVLVMVEIFIPSFTVFWFGLGAFVVALMLWFAPDTALSLQFFIWAVSSAIFTVLWFKFFKRFMPDRTKAGVARESVLGESGQVVKVPIDRQHGLVRFTTPVLGSDEWSFICDEPVDLGERVFVKEISGNTLVVMKRPLANGNQSGNLK